MVVGGGGSGTRGLALARTGWSPSEEKKRERKKARDVPSPPVLVRRCRVEEGGIHVDSGVGGGIDME